MEGKEKRGSESEAQGCILGVSGMPSSLIKILTHFEGGQPPKKLFVVLLVFKVRLPCFQCVLLYIYDEFSHGYMTITTILIVVSL